MDSVNENLSLTELVNSALVGIGDNPIESLYDTNNGKAKLCRMLVNQCIREVQCHPSACWDELEVYGELVLNETEYNKDAVSYNLPHNCLSIKWVKDENGIKLPYRTARRSIKTPRKAKYVCYISFSDNPEDWSPELKSCVISLLSAKMIAAISKDYAASRQAVESFWAIEFPRWAGNKINKGEPGVPGQDSELSVLWGEDPRTALNNPDWR